MRAVHASTLAAVIMLALAATPCWSGDDERSGENPMPVNPICWWELASHDADATVEFLRKAFDWTIDYDETVGYYRTLSGESAGSFGGGSIFTLRKAKLPFLTFYICVNDIDERAKRIEELGGHIVEAPHNISDKFRICLFNEPSGVTLAMLQQLDTD